MKKSGSFNLLFDLDGTLTDSKQGVDLSLRYAMEKIGKPLPKDMDLTWCLGPGIRWDLTQLLGGKDSPLVDQAIAHFRARYREKGMFENRVYPGIPEALDTLSRKARLYVATYKLTDFAEKILSHFGLARHFQAIQGSEPDGPAGDKGPLVRELMQSEGLDPSATFLVGDRDQDIKAARANHIPGIGALWGYGSAEELTKAGASALLKSPADLAPYFNPLA